MSAVFHLIAHTHWDREWYLPRGAFLARFVPLVDDVLDRLRADGAFRSFLLDGQTILLDDYLRVRPERGPEVRAAVAGGRIQAGPWFVLADELIPSAEALVRNLLIGTADAERLGHRLDALYSPDAFGHPAAWPALAREFGMLAGVIWRGVDSAMTGGGDRFRWRAPDGRDAFIWHLPAPGYEVGAALAHDPTRWPAVRAVLAPRAGGRHVAVFIGADHALAPRHVGLLREQLAEIDPENEFRISRLDEFLAAARIEAEGRELPIVSGELRAPGDTWVLQGTHATRLPLKRRNAVLELWLERVAEPLAALARRAGGADPRPLLDTAWRALLAGQFHDTLCGTVADSAAAEQCTRLSHVAALAREITRTSLLRLAGHDPDAAREDDRPAVPLLVLWNAAARPRGGVMVADVTWFRRDVLVGPPTGRVARSGPGAPAFALRAADGSAVGVQVLDQRPGLERRDASRHPPDLDEVDVVRVAFAAPPVPGLGIAGLTPGAAHPPPGDDGAGVLARALVNRYVEVAFEPHGALTLIDRTTRTRWAGLLRVESESDRGDAYTVQRPQRDRPARSGGPIRVRRLAAGPLVVALEAGWKLPCGQGASGPRRGHVAVRLTVTLYADSPVVRCVFELDNQARNHRLRARLPLGPADASLVVGAAFGSDAPAATAAGTPRSGEAPVATAPAHRWLAVAPGRPEARGLAVLAPGFFEYERAPGGDLIITLLRAVGELSRADLPARPGHAAWPAAIPAAQCLGRDRVELALVPVNRAAVARGDPVARFWEDTFLPLRGTWLRGARDPLPPSPGVTLEGAGLVVSALKPAQAGPGMVLRCWNATAGPVAGAWVFRMPVRAAYRVRADERESVPLVLEERGRRVRFTAAPREIVTTLIE